MGFDEILFAVSLLIALVLVAGSALGAADLAEVDGELHADADAAGVFALLGVGRVPLGILLLLFFAQLGGIGLAIAPYFHAAAGPVYGPWWSLGFALAGALLGTPLFARALALVLPSTETYASDKRELVGAEASVLSASRTGELVLRALDPGGAELRLRARHGHGALSVGERVRITAYDAERDVCEVERLSAG